MFAVPQSTTSESLKFDRATRYILLKIFKPFPVFIQAYHTLRSGSNHREVTCKTWSCLKCFDCHKNCTHKLSPDWENSLEAALEHPGYKIFLILADFRLSTRLHERRGDPR